MKNTLQTVAKEYHVILFLILLVLSEAAGYVGTIYLINLYPRFFRHYESEKVILLAIIVLLVTSIYLYFRYCREKSYRKATDGRSYSADNTKFGRSYTGLLKIYSLQNNNAYATDYFPKMNWRNANGLIFGKTKDGRLIHFEPEKNGICACIWGAPGDGKTTATIIPSSRQFGMDYSSGTPIQKGAVMVTDIKGDIYEANKDHRNIKRFSTIVPEESAHYDPLLIARQLDDNSRVEFIENQAVTIVPKEEGSDAAYWVDGARDFYIGIVLYELHRNPSISFPEIMKKIAVKTYDEYGAAIEESDCVNAQKYTNHFKTDNEKNVSGCYSKLVQSIRIFTNQTLSQLLTNDGVQITPDDLENCTDIYIQVDPNEMATIGGPVIAMIYEAFMSNALRREQHQTPPIAFIIDEFGQIPAMPVISRSAALMRGYNCSIMLSCQSLSMIEKHYGREGRKELMDCVKAHGFLSIMDPDTREWASTMIGTQKELVVSNSTQNASSSNTHTGKNVTEHEYRVIKPEDFGTLPDDKSIFIYYRGKYIKAKLTPYYEN